MVIHYFESNGENSQQGDIYAELGKVVHKVPIRQDALQFTGSRRLNAAFYMNGDCVGDYSILLATHAKDNSNLHKMWVEMFEPHTFSDSEVKLPDPLERIVNKFNLVMQDEVPKLDR
jgi:hypothetical protein